MQVGAMLNALPPYERKRDIIVFGEQKVKDIIKEVLNAHTRYSSDYDRITRFFKGNVPKKLFDFCRFFLPYREEPEADQTTRSPAAILSIATDETLHSIGLDCKHYAGFIAGVLDALNRTGYKFDWSYRFVSYDEDKSSPEHVFIVVAPDLWIDPTPIKDKKTGLYYDRIYNDRMTEPAFYVDLKPAEMLSTLHGIHYHVNFEDENINSPCMMNGIGCNDYNTILAPSAIGQTTTDPVVGSITETASKVAELLPDGGFKDWLNSFLKDPLGTVFSIFTGKTYTTGDYKLGEVYMRNILGMMEVQRRSQVPDSYVPQAWSFFTLALGVPIGSLDHVDQLVIGASNYKTWNNNSFQWVPDAQAERAHRILNDFIGWTTSYYPRDFAWDLSKFAGIPYIYPIWNIWDGKAQPVKFTGTHPILAIPFENGYPKAAVQSTTTTTPGSSTPGTTTPGSSTPIPTKQAGFTGLQLLLVGGLAAGLIYAVNSDKKKKHA